MRRILTIGHSTRSLDELVELLHHHQVGLLVDVRTVPASRRMPYFVKAALERSLPAHRVEYVHMPELGGLRKPRADSINTHWRNVGFRGYADYMQTSEFWQGIDRLSSFCNRGEEVAIMCAEAVPWRCHRSLISDALTARGVEVRHITSKTQPARHTITPFARVADSRITYAPPDTLPI
ncbi:MAG TPA: DUF488 domain-containing protein [Candidatus Dormibacteraeota bacterium]|nr:DUF488 domain-containing protein [Candidatus Dormibacteraeota bacterium]